MTFERVSGSADPYSPHVVTFANSTCAGGAYSFEFTDFSVAADELEQVASVASAGGRANDLAHNGVYRVIFVFTSASSNYTGATRVELSRVTRTDFLWLFGIGASICGSFGVGTCAKPRSLGSVQPLIPFFRGLKSIPQPSAGCCRRGRTREMMNDLSTYRAARSAVARSAT